MMHSRFRYSFLAFFVSAFLHASLWGFIITYKADTKPKPVEKIAMQVAMFKQAVIPQVVAKSEPVEKVKEPSVEKNVEKKMVSTAKPLSQPKPTMKAKPKKTIKKKKPKKKIKKKLRKKIKKKGVKKKVDKKKLRQKVIAKKKIIPRKPAKAYIAQKRPAPKQHRQVTHNERSQRSHQTPRIPSRQATGVSTPKSRAKPTPAAPQRAVARSAPNPQLEKQYQQSVQQKIEQQKNYPRRAKRMRQQGIVKVGFSLSRNGAISNLRIVQSSGISSLDNATLQAVKKVGRFSAFPAGINKPSISYIIPIAYRLN